MGKVTAKSIASEMFGKETKEKIYYTASFDGLCDLVTNDGEIKFLTFDKRVIEEVEIEGRKYLPPPLTSLPPNLMIAKANNVFDYLKTHDTTDDSDTSHTCKGCTTLFNNLMSYHKSISELPKENLYPIIVLWDFHTYLIEKMNFSPIIYFFSVAERGKSRTLKGMIYVAYRGIRKGDITDAQVLRDCTHLKASIAFDMMDFWDKVKLAGSQDVVLNRFERGLTVSRVNRPEKGAFQDTDYYDVFGPTIVATNEIVHEIVDTRSIPIIMRKSGRDFEDEVLPENAISLKEQLTAFRLAHFNDTLPTVKKTVKSRLGDIIRPFHQILLKVNPKLEVDLLTTIKEIEKTKLIEKSSSFDSDVLKAFISSEQSVINGSLASQEVANCFNKDRDEKEKLTSQKIANRLSSLGFEKTRTGTGARAFFWDVSLIQKLIEEYDLNMVRTVEVAEVAEVSDVFDDLISKGGE